MTNTPFDPTPTTGNNPLPAYPSYPPAPGQTSPDGPTGFELPSYGQPPAQPYGAPLSQPYGAPLSQPYSAPPVFAATPAQPYCAPPAYGPRYEPYGVPPAYGVGGTPLAPYGYAPPARQNTLAVVSLVFGICGVTVLWFVGSIVALATGYSGKKQIAQTGEQGASLATAGIVLGWVGAALGALFLAIFILPLVLAAIFAGSI